MDNFSKKALSLKLIFFSIFKDENNATSLFLIGFIGKTFNLLDLKVCPVDDISITTSAASFLIKPSVAPWLSINLKSVIPNSF